MELSYFLAQLLGLTLAIVAGCLFVRPVSISQMMTELQQSHTLRVVLGMLGVLGSLAIILSHNVWELSFVTWVTLFGWLGLLKSVVYLIAPDVLVQAGSYVYRSTNITRITLFLACVFGLYLAAAGFQIPWHST